MPFIIAINGLPCSTPIEISVPVENGTFCALQIFAEVSLKGHCVQASILGGADYLYNLDTYDANMKKYFAEFEFPPEDTNPPKCEGIRCKN